MGDICWSRGIFLKGCVIISVSVLTKPTLNLIQRLKCAWVSRQTECDVLSHLKK